MGTEMLVNGWKCSCGGFYRAVKDGCDFLPHAADCPHVVRDPPLTHRPSRLDAEHTACGIRLSPSVHLHLGDGETCERCTHVVAQVAAALRGEPSWAQKAG